MIRYWHCALRAFKRPTLQSAAIFSCPRPVFVKLCIFILAHWLLCVALDIMFCALHAPWKFRTHAHALPPSISIDSVNLINLLFSMCVVIPCLFPLPGLLLILGYFAMFHVRLTHLLKIDGEANSSSPLAPSMECLITHKHSHGIAKL